jgi:hypothetical protein
MHRLIALTSCLLLVPALGHASPPKPKLGIFNVSVVGLDKSLQQTAIDALASAAAGLETFEVVSRTEVDAMISAEKLGRRSPHRRQLIVHAAHVVRREWEGVGRVDAGGAVGEVEEPAAWPVPRLGLSLPGEWCRRAVVAGSRSRKGGGIDARVVGARGD